MKLKRLVLSSAALVAVLSLASCGGSDKESKSTKNNTTQSKGSVQSSSKSSAAVSTSSEETTSTTLSNPFDILTNVPEAGSMGSLDISINYNAEQGVSIREDSFPNPVESITYNKGDITPTFKRFQELTGISQIRDSNKYSTDVMETYYQTNLSNNFQSETSVNETIDLIYLNTSNINSGGAASKFIDLSKHLEEMPYFSKWLNSHENVKSLITTNNSIYYTPYFDGLDYIEKMINLDHSMVEKLLDSNSTDSFDTLISGKGGAANTLKEAKYQPFINPDYNYESDRTIQVSDYNSRKHYKEIEVTQTENIIKQQNESLANGITGKELAEQLRAYLNTAFANPLSDGTYKKLSDIFLSEQAAYNTDELIALMRVVKANPVCLTNDETAEIEILCPRGAAHNRIDNILMFAQVWGIQGLAGEKDRLYFDANGKLNDAASTPATYEALEYLHQIYDEGLIADKFSLKSSDRNSNYFLDNYFKRQSAHKYGFMLYDYNATISQANFVDENGVGVKESELADKNSYTTGIGPVVSPISWWATSKDYDHDQELTNHKNKELIRYTEDNRTLKGTSWAIPSNSDNVTGALKMMDIMYSQIGSWINNYGPEKYWETSNFDEMDSYAGEKTPTLNEKTYKMLNETADDMWSDMRAFVGATHGIGNVRPSSMNYQSISNYAKQKAENVDNAVASKQLLLATTEPNTGLAMAQSVPSSGYGSIGDDTKKTYDAVSGFFHKELLSSDPYGWTLYVQRTEYPDFIDSDGQLVPNKTLGYGVVGTETAYTYNDVLAQRYNERIKTYLYEMAMNLGTNMNKNYIPSYINI